ncbi:hypothetical protein DRH27_04320 [Candidatus Falkowbacteria bacterium]|nr:MAG: hypothetical protein DRH27_04320 [Candidatus Falkowbacteria bacterium]
MAKLTDPDSYNLYVHATTDAGAGSEEIVILTGPKTVQLRVEGNLNDTAPGKTSGGTAKSAYSFLKEEYVSGTDAATLRRFKFPIKMIFEGSFIWTNGWAPADDQTRDLFRDAGFEESVSSDIYACMISLGSINAPASDLAYYTQAQTHVATTTVYDKTGELNENIDITGLTTYQRSLLRVQGKTYAEYELLNEQGLSSIGFQAYSFPLTNLVDSKITETDGNIDSQAPYTSMEINFIKGVGFTTAAAQGYVTEDVVQDAAGRWAYCSATGTLDAAGALDYNNNGGTGTFEAYFGEEQIGSTYYAFNREVDAGTGTDIEAHEYMSRQLRQTGEINDDTGITAGQDAFGTVNGEVAQLLSTYVGDTLLLKPGVVLRNFDANSTNNITHQPITVDTSGLDDNDVPLASSEVSFPFVAAGNFVFSQNYVDEADADTAFTVYFDYITTQTAITLATTSSASDVTTFTDSGSGMTISAGDYFYVTGFLTNATNNGLYLETGGSPTNASVTATKQDGVTVIDEAAGDSVTVITDPYESPGAVIVKDDGGTDMDGLITAATIGWDFDYTNNVQGGRTANQDAACTIVAIAKDGAEWIDATFTISASTGINVPVNGGDERNYENV